MAYVIVVHCFFTWLLYGNVLCYCCLSERGCICCTFIKKTIIEIAVTSGDYASTATTLYALRLRQLKLTRYLQLHLNLTLNAIIFRYWPKFAAALGLCQRLILTFANMFKNFLLANAAFQASGSFIFRLTLLIHVLGE